MNICSRCGYQNTDDSKKCANCLVDLHWAKVNLGKFSGTPDDTKRIGEEESKLHSVVITEDRNKPDPLESKSRDIAIGFFGWFLLGNLVLWFEIAANLDLTALYFGVPLVTVIAIGTLFYKKMNWFAYGIIAAVITNILIMEILGSIALSPSLEGYLFLLLFGVSFPLPVGIFALMQ